MALILIVLLLALLLGGLGFAIHILWWLALIVLFVWLLGFLIRVGEGAGRGRWYRWLPGRPQAGSVSTGQTCLPGTATMPARRGPRPRNARSWPSRSARAPRDTRRGRHRTSFAVPS
jgi:hypothetical protein